MGVLRVAAATALVALFLTCAATAAGPTDGWTSFGNDPERTSDVPAIPTNVSRDFVLPLDGRIVGQVLESGDLFYAATTAGEVVAFTPDGYIRWRDDVGQLAVTCQQLDGYGVISTGAIDANSNTLYVADAFGRLHALDLGSGAERDGWPVRVFSDYRKELAWGALTIADGAVYVPTGAYCDSSSLGGVYRVDTATQQISAWISVPSTLGGGGGPWGWGGVTYDAQNNVLYAATSGAFSGGSNTGDNYTETAGYGDRLVQLGPDLSVGASSHPADLPDRQDLDFVGSPITFDKSGCGKLVVATDKDDTVYAWRAGAIDDGPIWEVKLQSYDISDPMLSNIAWSPGLSSLYAVTGTQLVRVTIDADCNANIDWSEQLGTHTENGSPTIAGNTVWFAVNGTPRLVGYDAKSGNRVFSAPLGGTTVEAPTIINDRLVIGTMTGLVEGFSFGTATEPRVKTTKTSWVDARYGWQDRATGVYATDNGGKSWHRIYVGPALDVMRLSKTSGLISIGDAPGACMCSTRQFWTADAGVHWHETTTLSEEFAKGGGHIYFWEGGRLSMVATLPRQVVSNRIASKSVVSFTDGTIKEVQPILGGVAMLVSSRVHGQNWDTAPRVVLVHGNSAQTMTLPTQTGRWLVQHLTVSGQNLTVTATDFNTNPAHAAVWDSSDGGATWGTG